MKTTENLKAVNIMLLEPTSPLYAKRVVREINSLLRSGKPVYAVLGHRNASVVRVQTQFGDCAIIAEDINGTKHRVSSNDFIDGNGNEVCASRAQS